MAEIDDLLSEIQSFSSKKAIRDLLHSGVDVNFLDEMVDIFKNGILSKQNKTDLLKQFEQYIKGGDGKLGKLERYVKQVHSDAVTQYVANYSEALTEDLGLVFYQYIGNIQDDTRCFCEERVNNYYHRKEIESWGNGDGVGECGYPWAGMISGTNASNIFTYRGGWNCEHQFVAVLTTSVPLVDILRAVDLGYYEPNRFEAEFFGI